MRTPLNWLIALGLALPAVAPAGVQALPRGEHTAAGEGVYQLRIYEIFEANKAAFHDRFRDHAAPIMRRHGFDIVAMWEARSAQRTEFVYVLRWPDEPTMQARWARFMADPDWSRIKAETAARQGQMVGSIQERVMRMTAYSP